MSEEIEKVGLTVDLDKDKTEIDIVVEDDTPPEDRGKTPMPKPLVEELEADELDDYSDKVKTRFKQMKKVWHDERREKEIALREQQEAIRLAHKVIEENKRLKNTLSQGEQTLVSTYKAAADLELQEAERSYKEAYEAGDADKLVVAQRKLALANHKLAQIGSYQPTLQTPDYDVQDIQNVAPPPRPDAKTLAWQERNEWWGSDPEMTASAMGLHRKLEETKGAGYIGSDEYWQTIDTTMRRRFPEYFGEDDNHASGGGRPVTRNNSKSATVVAPASRSTSSKRIVLKQSQVALAKKLNITPEQYAREYLKTYTGN